MNCPNCGKENREEEKFCEDCGAQLAVSTMAPEPDESAGSRLEAGYKLSDRYLIVSSQVWGSGNKYYAKDLANNDADVILFERTCPQDGNPEFNPLKLQWEILKKLADPRFPRLIDFFEDGDRSFLAMENFSGESLDVIIKRQATPFEPQRVVKWGISICDAISALHKDSILHRDLQPSNFILQSDDSILIAGFDRMCPADKVPEQCAVTPGFSAPEAYGIGESKIDTRSDIYSVGASLYSLLTGKTPLLEQRDSFFSFPTFSEYKIKVVPTLEKAIMTSVSKKAEDRFPDLQAFKQALESITTLTVEETAPVAAAEEQKALSINVGMKTHIGNVREINQDSCLFMNFAAYEKSELSEAAVVVVADGMGGEAEGEKASSFAVRVIAKQVLSGYFPVQTEKSTKKLLPGDSLERGKVLIAEALKEANKVVFKYAGQDPSRKGMGSTISAAIIEGNNLIVGHAGDTRVYLIRDTIEQISEDHSLVGRLVKMGQLKKEEALRSPQRSLVYRALGTAPELEVDTTTRKLRENDCVLLCSDGVWEYFIDDELLAIVTEVKDPQGICERLIELCLERGADDNCTAIVVRMG